MLRTNTPPELYLHTKLMKSGGSPQANPPFPPAQLPQHSPSLAELGGCWHKQEPVSPWGTVMWPTLCPTPCLQLLLPKGRKVSKINMRTHLHLRCCREDQVPEVPHTLEDKETLPHPRTGAPSVGNWVIATSWHCTLTPVPLPANPPEQLWHSYFHCKHLWIPEHLITVHPRKQLRRNTKKASQFN